MYLALGHKIAVVDCQVHPTPVPTVEFRDTEAGIEIILMLESPELLRVGGGMEKWIGRCPIGFKISS